MANKTYKPLLIDSIEAQADLTEKTFVGFDGNVCGANEKAYGVVDVATEAGQPAPVGVLGTFLVIAGGAITQGTAITSDANGKAVAIAADDDLTPDIINGYALDSATEAGEEIRIIRGV